MFLTGTKKMLGDRIFLQKAVRIALPVAMQGMLNTIVNLVDTMMIGTLGETTIAAVGLANKVFFVFSLLVSVHGDHRGLQRPGGPVLGQ